MDPIPENWPPAPPQVLPLFPLANVWLFPYVILPLHIFEPRYRQMIEDILDDTGRFVLGTIEEGHEAELQGAPPVYPIAGLGEIGRHERLENGRFEILLLGLKRVHVREVESDRLYRRVEIAAAEETPTAPEKEPRLRKQLERALIERTKGEASLGQEVSISHLADRLSLHMPLPHQVLNELYCELDEERRARRALAEHRRRPSRTEEEGEDS